MNHSKKLIRIVCVALAILMGISIVVPLVYAFADDSSSSSAAGTSASSSSAATSSSSSKADTTSTANTLKSEVQRLQEELDAINNEIDSTKSDIKDTQNLKAYYQQQANTLKAQIEAIKTDISNTETALAEKQTAVEQKVLEVADTKALFEQRLRAMYMMHDDNSLSTLLGVTSFSEMLRYSENLSQMSTNDTQLIATLRTEQADLETQRASIETDLAALQDNQTLLEQKSAEYSQSIQNANSALTQQEADLEAKDAAYAEKKKEYEAAQQTWKAFAMANNVSFVYGGGKFAWPIPGYYSLSSDFGTVRTIYGVTDVHRGMDVPAPLGTPIYAAYEGQVSTTAHWSYGTCVKIDHGSGLVTIYGHMSARAVSDGQYVSQGELIGYVGSTGNSTGNHLHFEVDLNGTPVSAWPYLNG